MEESAHDGERLRTEGAGRGYTAFGAIAENLEAVIHIVWVTASRMTTQSPFLQLKGRG